MKSCSRCGKVLALERFNWARPGLRAAECAECQRSRNNKRNRYMRLLVLKHYGGDPPKCWCCGVDFAEFLSLDHINGGGRQHRQSIKIRWWEWIIKNGYPEGFRVACHNCNQAVGLYGYCPHQKGSLLLQEASAYDPTKPNSGYKLNPVIVAEIKNLLAGGWAQYKIAARYNVSRATICLINGGKRWADPA